MVITKKRRRYSNYHGPAADLVTAALRLLNDSIRRGRLPSPCYECGAPVKVRPGPHGLFFGCSRWPRCRGARDYPYLTPEAEARIIAANQAARPYVCDPDHLDYE